MKKEKTLMVFDSKRSLRNVRLIFSVILALVVWILSWGKFHFLLTFPFAMIWFVMCYLTSFVFLNRRTVAISATDWDISFSNKSDSD